jgi:hypothetical protein
LTDEELRKKADARRPMLVRKMLMFDMDDRIDLDALYRKQLNPEGKFHGNTTREQESDGRTRSKEDGRGGH